MSSLIWQLIDSGFPAGAFAHSAGLEATVRHGHITNPAGVYAFARQTMTQAGRGALPIVNEAYQRLDTLPELDRLVDVFLSNPIANRASRAQGRALISSAIRCFPHAQLDAIDECVRRERLCAHHAPVYGSVLRRLGVEPVEAQRAFLFMAVRAVTSSAVRLGLLGAYEAQELLILVSDGIDRTIEDCRALTPADIAQTAPLIDVFQSTHDRLYSRLFQS
jgi:urease accessory protein